MDENPLEDKNIFIIPVGAYLGEESDAYQLVYAPFAAKMLVADTVGMKQLPEFLSKLIVEGGIAKLQNQVRCSNELTKMAVLPNHSCNFNCSYCYSANGRSNTVLKVELLDNALSYFIDPNRLTERSLNLTFIGGGEPLLSWPIVKHGIEYAHRLATLYEFNLQTTITTNGSIMTEDILNTIKSYKVLPNISFDILEGAQNKHRRHYERVCHTLDMCCEYGVLPVVIATITPDSVDRMEEMFDLMEQRFPLIGAMSFEPVISNELFGSAEELRTFYDSFLQHFFLAREKAKSKGKTISCRIYRNVHSLLDRGCPSKLTLTPQGELSICYCVSSAKEKKYEERVFGAVDQDGVKIDEDRFQRVNGINVYSFKKCESCFAKWHCAGGCMCANDRYDDGHLREVCRFTKEMVKRALMERIKDKCRKDRKDPLEILCHSAHIIEL